jgi:hypothetical protein
MADVTFPKRSSLLPRDLDLPPRPRAYEQPIDHSADLDPRGTVNTREPLDEIATVVRGLTYGEMIEFAETLWKAQPEGSAITQENLPSLLHRWSTIR